MRPISNFLHKTPWWLLLFGGLGALLALGLFTTPFEVMRLQKSGATPEENRAIKREIDSTFTDRALDVSRTIVHEMRERTHDKAGRAELDRALEEIDQARENMRDASHDALQARREAAAGVAQAVKEATDAIAAAQKAAGHALDDAAPAGEQVKRLLEESMRAAQEAKREAALAGTAASAPSAPAAITPPATPAAPPEIVPPAAPEIAPPAAPSIAPPAHRVFTHRPIIDIHVGDGPGANTGPTPPLPPEMRDQIRRKVTGDLYRIGLGSGLILVFIPLFLLTVVSKIFIDRSRAAQDLAELKRKEAEYHRMGRQVTEAKLSALQAQVEPHFLYNTLASVQALTEVDPQQASAMTGHLIQYLRNALPKMRESVSTVGQEVELARAYLNILQMRMGKRLAFEIAVPVELMEAPFPPLMLPSLVENAIKHGLEPQREGGTVTISAEARDGRLRVRVADSGRGFGEALGSGVGLANIRERLAALYGSAATLTLEAQEPRGVVATIEVPRDGARQGAAAFAAAGAPPAPGAAATPARPAAQGATRRTLAALGTAERAWRKGLSFAFVVLVALAAVCAGLGIVSVAAGIFPVQAGEASLAGATGALLGTAGIAAAFAVVVLALAIVLAVVYGLGFLFAGLAIFIPLAILVGLFPALAPLILVGLATWWLVRRSRRKAAAAALQPPAAAP